MVYRAGVTGTTREEKVSRQKLKMGVDTGLYYYGARYYDPKISVWLSVDPLAHKFPSWSPYAAFNNNPILFIDPDGRAASPVFGKDGDLLGTDSEGWEGEAIVMDENDFEQGMDHDEALNKGTELGSHGEGINISDEDWQTVEDNGGSRMSPFVENNSNRTIGYKPEGNIDSDGDGTPDYRNEEAYPIAPNTDLYVPVDGVKTPTTPRMDVHKVPTGYRVIINPNGGADIISWPDCCVPGYGETSTPSDGTWDNLRDFYNR